MSVEMHDEPTGSPYETEHLEGRIGEVISWGRILRHLGMSGADVDGDDLIVIGDAIDTLGGRMQDDYAVLTRKMGKAR